MRGPNRPKIKDHAGAGAASTTTSADVDDPAQQQHKSPRTPSSSPPFTPPTPSSTAAATGVSHGRKRAPSHPHPAPRSPLGIDDTKTADRVDRERERDRDREKKRPLPLFVSVPRPGAAGPPLLRQHQQHQHQHHHARPSVVVGASPSVPVHASEGVFEASYGMGMIPTIAAGEGFGVGGYEGVGVGSHAQVGYAYGPAGFHPPSTRGQAAELISPVLVEGCPELAGSTTTWVFDVLVLQSWVLMLYFLGGRVVLSRRALGITGRHMRIRIQARCSRR